MRRHVVRLAAMAAVLAVLAVAGLTRLNAHAGPLHGVAAPAVHVRGAALVDATGHRVQLRGVNRSGFEYACVKSGVVGDGPLDDAAISAMVAWHINVVRVPLNESCWLGLAGTPETAAGRNYRAAVLAYVHRLHAHGLLAVLSLQWGPGATLGTGQQRMPDAAHAVAFWQSIARSFRADQSVLLDLVSEPHDVSWSCWLDGCPVHDRGEPAYRVVGMQTLVDAIRGTGARQPLIIAGLRWANDLSGISAHLPRDVLHQLIVSAHVYNFNKCSSRACWNATIGPLTASLPVVALEFGERGCRGDFSREFMNWADQRAVGYLAWTWNDWSCSAGPALIKSYDGRPTPYGVAIRDHFAAVAGRTH